MAGGVAQAAAAGWCGAARASAPHGERAGRDHPSQCWSAGTRAGDCARHAGLQGAARGPEARRDRALAEANGRTSPRSLPITSFSRVRIVRNEDLVVLCEIRARPVWIARRHVLNQALPPKAGLRRVAIPRWLASDYDLL